MYYYAPSPSLHFAVRHHITCPQKRCVKIVLFIFGDLRCTSFQVGILGTGLDGTLNVGGHVFHAIIWKLKLSGSETWTVPRNKVKLKKILVLFHK